MDIGNLNSRAAQTEGAFLHLRHPATDLPLWDGEEVEGNEVGVYVRGKEYPPAQRLARKMADRKFKNYKEEEAAGLAYASILISGFKNLSTEGRPLEATDDDKKLFLEMSDAFVDQVMEFAQERANFSMPASGS